MSGSLAMFRVRRRIGEHCGFAGDTVAREVYCWSSSVESSVCDPRGNIKGEACLIPERELLILACSRSGTQFTSELLRLNGLDVGHEVVGGFGAIGWMYAISDREYFHQRRSGRAELFRFKTVWHQVREPLAAINSFSTHEQRMIDWILARLGVRARSRLHAQMLYWLRWNRLCQSQATWTYRVEELRPGTKVWERVRGALRLSTLHDGVAYNANTRRQRRSYTRHTWPDLYRLDAALADEIRFLALTFGYPAAQVGHDLPSMAATRIADGGGEHPR